MAKLPEHRRAVGRNIRAFRKQADLTIERLAEKADMSWSYLCEVENGKENISLDKLARIAGALDVALTDLVKGA